MSQDAKAEYDALRWVKPELDVLLDSARQALETYVEDQSRQELLAKLLQLLKQVRGTLQIVDLPGGVMFAEEMEALTQALESNQIKNREAALGVLTTAILQLPAYLEHIQAGHADSPLIILPILNDLRASREAPLLSENIVFLPRIEVQEDEVDDLTGQADLVEAIKTIRPVYQRALLKVLKDQLDRSTLEKMAYSLDSLAQTGIQKNLKTLWRTAAALVDTLDIDEAVPVAIKLLLGRLERVQREVIRRGEIEVAKNFPSDLLKNILFYVGRSPNTSARLESIRAEFNLNELVPPVTDLEQARQKLASPDLKLLETVEKAALEDLAEVRDQVEIFTHAKSASPLDLGPIAEQLRKIGDTLSILGLAHAGNSLVESANQIKDAITNHTALDEAMLMKLAETMLNAEHALREMVQLRREGEHGSSEISEVRAAGIHEALRELNKVKDALLQYYADQSNTAALKAAIKSLQDIGAALSFIQVYEPAQRLQTLSAWVEGILQQSGVLPALLQNDLAELITAIEMYLESFADQHKENPPLLSRADEILERLQSHKVQPSQEPALTGLDENDLQKTGSESALSETTEPSSPTVKTQTPKVAASTSMGIGTQEDTAFLDAESLSVLKKSEEPLKTASIVEKSSPVTGEEPPAGLKFLRDDADVEILEIFIEEAKEEIERISEYLPKWQENTSDEESLATIRRSFHTLKGSGRIAGAELLGEFAWIFENLLNRILSHSIDVSKAHFDLLNEAVLMLRRMVGQLEGESEPPTGKILSLMERAKAAAKEKSLPSTTPAEQKQAEPQTEIVSNHQDVQIDAFGATPQAEETLLEAPPDLSEEGEPGLIESKTAPVVAGEETSATSIRPIEAIPPATEETPQETEAKIETGESAESKSEDEDMSKGPAQLSEETQTPDLETAGHTELSFVSGQQESLPEHRASAELINIFTQEARRHLNALENALSYRSGKAGINTIDERCIVALHTLNGSSRAIDVPSLSSLFGPLEKALDQLKRRGRPLSHAIFQLMQEVIPASESTLDALEQGKPLPDTSALASRIASVVDGLQNLESNGSEPGLQSQEPSSELPTTTPPIPENEPLSETGPAAVSPKEFETDNPADKDEELTSIFLEEAEELIRSTDEAIERWENGRDDSREAIEIIQRDLHTLKGSARMAGYKTIGDLTHALESHVFALVENPGSVPAEEYSLLHKAVDRLSDMLQSVRDKQPVHAQNELITELSGRLSIPLGESSQPPAAIKSQHDVESSQTLPFAGKPGSGPAEISILKVDTSTSRPSTTQAGQPSEKPAQNEVAEIGTKDITAAVPPASEISHKPTAEQVRIRAELLDKLVNQAGEVNIYHSRLEQQFSSSENNLMELDQTISRLRNQLRKLELETEAQILYRFKGGKAANGEFDESEIHQGFDPLELDRYSNIQQLSRALAESLNDLNSIENFLMEGMETAQTLLRQQQRVSTDLQEGLMRSRMVPFGVLGPRLRRIVRQTAEELGKSVNFRIEGDQSELDRIVLDRLAAPLEHILRNAVDHGLEQPEERLLQSKPEKGLIRIHVSREGAEIVIEIEDDGRGIDIQAVRKTAIDKGLIAEDATLDEKHLMQLIMEPGFTTTERLSQISGRGVGLDVVTSEVKQLGGQINIESEPGKGTRFTLRLPFTLSITQALLVYAEDSIFSLPLAGLTALVRIQGAELERLYSQQAPYYEYLGENYELRPLLALLERRPSVPAVLKDMYYPVLLLRSGTQGVALQAERLGGSQEIVVNSLGSQFSRLRGVAGATILGDGQVSLVLDPAGLVRHAALIGLQEFAAKKEVKQTAVRKPTIMVVDDSITIRKVTARVLERHGYDVVTARDGMEAVALLEERKPDLVLTDIEMPRMDGYELSSHMRNDARFKDIPIVMITSRTGDKHRLKAKELGIEHYIGKPYQESELIDTLHELVATK